jgi:hypothetical protein
MGLLDEARVILSRGEDFPFCWTLPLVAALGPDGRRLSIVWVRRCLSRLLPFTEDEWQRNLLRPELERLAEYETQPPTQEELQRRLAYIHQIFHQGAQPAVSNLFVAWMHSRFRATNDFAKSQEFALAFMLSATGNRPEHREAILEEYVQLAEEACSRAAPGALT